MISGSCSVAGLDFLKTILQTITNEASEKRNRATLAARERTICHFSGSVMTSAEGRSQKKISLRQPQDAVEERTRKVAV